MRMTFRYHDASLKLDLGTRTGVTVAGGIYPPPLGDPDAALRRAIQHTIGSPALERLVPAGGRITVLVSDITRSGGAGAVLPGLLASLEELGAAPDRVDIVLAMGMHRAHSREEIENHLGSAIVSRWHVFEHNAKDESSLVFAGNTGAGTQCFFNRRVVESRLVIVCGSLSFHYFAGFGGARKLILPGVAGVRTILANHRRSLMADPRGGLSNGCRPGNLEGNPVHEDMLEGARLIAAPVFVINSVADDAGRIVYVNAGDLDASHLEGCVFLMKHFRSPMSHPYRVVIASAGGYPKDINLLQSHKAIRHASYALEEGGIMMVAAACPEGIGSPSLEDAFRMGTDSVTEIVAGQYTLNAQAAVSLHELTEKYTIFLKSMLGDDETSRFGFKRWEIERCEALLEGIPDEDVCIIPDAATFLPSMP